MIFILTGSAFFIMVLPIMFNYFREEYGYRGALLLWAGILLNSVPLGMLMTMHPQLGHTPVPTGSPPKHQECPLQEDYTGRKECDTSRQDEKHHSKNESTKPKIRIKFQSLKDDLECKNGSVLNGLENTDCSARKPSAKEVDNCLPERLRQEDSACRSSVNRQFSLDNVADKDIENLPLPGTSLVGELR